MHTGLIKNSVQVQIYYSLNSNGPRLWIYEPNEQFKKATKPNVTSDSTSTLPTGVNFNPFTFHDRLCGLVVRVSGYRYRGPGFDSRRYQIFWVVVGLERGPLSLVRSIEELLE